MSEARRCDVSAEAHLVHVRRLLRLRLRRRGLVVGVHGRKGAARGTGSRGGGGGSEERHGARTELQQHACQP
jgi:hypothetical protein